MKPRLVFLSVVPSPYQRDVFRAITRRENCQLKVHYLERAAPDSPWPVTDREPWEHVLPGITAGRGRWRSHLNWNLPEPQPDETWIVNGAMTDVTTQRMMRRLGQSVPWCFWGELPSSPRTAWRRWVQARQYAPLRAAFAIVAVGERAREAYRRLVPGVPVFNQPYACELAAFAAAADERVPRHEPVFLFCGQMIARKGIDVLLEAFETVVAAGSAGRLELIGREADLAALLAQLSPRARARVHYHGFKPPAELPAWFARADVFVLPSRHDGWGVVINQALGARLPVIASDAVGAARDLIRNGVNGLIVPAGEPSALAAAMHELAQSRTLRESMSGEAARTALHLTPDNAAAFWEELAESFSRAE